MINNSKDKTVLSQNIQSSVSSVLSNLVSRTISKVTTSISEKYEELEDIKSPQLKGHLAHGAYLLYNALKTQLEIDEMNEAWGQ